MSKYIDPEDTLLQSCHKAHDYPFVMDVKIVLAWLDNHPDQVPGRTITEGDYSDIAEWARNYSNRGWEGRTVLAGAGITIVPDPDPEPTNAERLAELIREIGYDIRHKGRLSGSNALALDLDSRGVRVVTESE